MKNFSELSTCEQFEVIASIKKLSEQFKNRVIESEIDFYIMEKINALECVDYSIGICNRNYLEIKGRFGEVEKDDAKSFLYSLQKVVKSYGCSIRCEKQIAKCEKLIESHLFVYECKRLCDMYFEDDIQPTIDYCEDLSYALYCKKYDKEFADTFDWWIECKEIDGTIFYDEEEKKWCYSETTNYYAA